MSDEEDRKLARRAREGDAAAEQALGRSQSRNGGVETTLSFVDGLVGKLVWIEGLRINYRGILRRVIRGFDGRPELLVFDRLQRVSWFQQNGPEQGYSFLHTKERGVPWDTVLDIGEESFNWEAP